jgi:hypothetical protein
VIRMIHRWTKRQVPMAGTVLLALTIFHVVAPTRAWAYLDPITGSIVLQVLAAGFLAAMATYRKFREWVAGLFRRRTADPE